MKANWKNVKNELPTEDGTYMVFGPYFGVSTGIVILKSDFHQGEPYWKAPYGAVTHWDYLPNIPVDFNEDVDNGLLVVLADGGLMLSIEHKNRPYPLLITEK